jgi:uncharacterized protein YggU (UPF0235/DUF167 family)
MEALRATVTRAGAVRFEVWARPRARAARLSAVRDGALVVHLAAPPVDGAANDELLAALAEALGLPKRCIAVVRGITGRSKLVEVRGLTAQELRARLHAAIG